jgi:glycyl-tRNA synthetase beta chain
VGKVPELLLEIGCEELPARAAPGALAQLGARTSALLQELRLGGGAPRLFGTPRRLGVWVADVAERQPDTEEWVRGPARGAAFDAEGRPTPAALGFARAQGVAVADLAVRAVGDREYVFALRRSPGRPALAVLGERLPALVTGLEFPKSMRWGSLDIRFGRPIRWLLALLDDEVVPFTLGEVRSGRVSFGHRSLHPGAVEVARPADYPAALAAAGVVADPEERARRIRDGCRRAAAGVGRPRTDPDLLAEVTWLVEHPYPFLGSFPEEALAVPEPVLVEVMRVQQRYFPVEAEDGRLLPRFCGVRDGDGEHLAQVVAGNERVLRARFADARFFYEEDRRRPLAERAGELHRVLFAEGLGTLADKAARLAELATHLLPAGGEALRRAALLCKADRLTHLVTEFPELEGTMGAHYAERDGEPAEVVAAIAEHVLPRAAGGELPRSERGRALALADRLDNLAGHFLAGHAPTGSQDPFGLRRQAIAALRILADWELDLGEAAAFAMRLYGRDDALPDLLAFLRARLRGLMEEAGHRYDAVEAVLAKPEWRVPVLWGRLRELEALLASPLAADVLTVYRRAANLSAKLEGDAAVDPELLATDEERALWRALQQAQGRPHAEAVAGLRPALDALLERVLIMAPERELRRNRLALLAAVAAFAARDAALDRVVGA